MFRLLIGEFRGDIMGFPKYPPQETIAAGAKIHVWNSAPA